MDEILHSVHNLKTSTEYTTASRRRHRERKAAASNSTRLHASHTSATAVVSGRRICRSASSAAERVGRTYRAARVLAASRGYVGRIPFLILAVLLCTLFACSTVYQTGYSVSVDGINIGVTASKEDFENAISRVEARAADVLGQENYTYARDISYSKTLVRKDHILSGAASETALFGTIGEIMKRYVLTVNGVYIGAAESKETLDSILNTYLAAYQTEHTTSAEIIGDVYMSYQYVTSDVTENADQMLALLSQNQEEQTLYTVVRGDTFNGIAYRHDMSPSELSALNPDVIIDKLSIGQELVVKKAVPFLSVRVTENRTYIAEIPCPVEKVNDSSMYVGNSKVITEGTPGTARVNADIVYEDGVETARTVLSSETLSEPTTTVMAVGTAPRPKTASNGYYIWPVSGRITSSYGNRTIFGTYSFHPALDIAAAYGTNIKASDGGTVTFAGYKGTYGNLIIITHDNGSQTYYAHCSKLLVSKGAKVYQGQVIGKVGTSGRATGAHVHFEIRINGSTVNPLNYL